MIRALFVLLALGVACGCSGAQQAQDKTVAATGLDDLCQLRALQKDIQAARASSQSVIDVFADAGHD